METSSDEQIIPGTDERVATARVSRWPVIRTLLLLLLGFAVWILLYRQLGQFAYWYTYQVMKYPWPSNVPQTLGNACCGAIVLPPGAVASSVRLGVAVNFLIYQLTHVFMLLSMVVFLMGIVRSFFSPERTRALLTGKRGIYGNLLGALLGVVTPFCSCSAVPLFIGFVTAGVPLGTTFTFLTAAPMVNELALILLFNTYGWQTAGIYLIAGLTIALFTGWLISRLRMERYVEDWVLQTVTSAEYIPEERMTLDNRVAAGFHALRDILKRVWLFVIIGILAGAVIHVYVSREALVSMLGNDNWWSVPLAVIIGVPIYSNAAGIIPVVEALRAKLVPPGTLLAFMMAVVTLSLPEFIVLRKVLKPPLIAFFVGVVTLGIILVGILFNLILPAR
ncbi:MAG: permease [Armatimonadota bacterium]